jgi:peptidyl-prolyl cis-trans isomerase B (cyclophilin B)
LNLNSVKGNEMAKVKLATNMGDIVIELNEEKAPITSENFLSYVKEGFFDGLIFHRVIKDFMIQGGGFTADMNQKKTRKPIVNEANNGLKNDRGTIAMARTNDPNSATAQFFINHKNNNFLNYAGPGNPGYAVFGKTAEGIEVVDKIAEVETSFQKGMDDVPVKQVIIESATIID